MITLGVGLAHPPTHTITITSMKTRKKIILNKFSLKWCVLCSSRVENFDSVDSDDFVLGTRKNAEFAALNAQRPLRSIDFD